MDTLAVIKQVIAEHKTVRENLKMAGDRVSDIEAVFALRRTYADWTQASLETLQEKLQRTKEAVGILDLGMKNHFAFEEESLPPIFGKMLMDAIIAEHHVFNQQLADATTLLASTKLEGRTQPELLVVKVEIQQTINNIVQVIDAHATHEDVILEVIEKSITSGEASNQGEQAE